MRNLTMMCAATALIAGPAVAQEKRPRGDVLGTKAPARCNPTAGVADYRGGKAPPRKLGEMPPANQIYTVYNVVNGCPQPVVVRKGIGGNTRQPVSPPARRRVSPRRTDRLVPVA